MLPTVCDAQEIPIKFQGRRQEVDGQRSLGPENARGPSAPDKDDPGFFMVHLTAYRIQKRSKRFHHVFGVSADIEGLDRFEGTADHKNLSRLLGAKAHRLCPKPPTHGVCSDHHTELVQAFILSRPTNHRHLADRDHRLMQPFGSTDGSLGTPADAARRGRLRSVDAEVGVQRSFKEGGACFLMICSALQRGKARVDRPGDPRRRRIRTFECENLQRLEGGGDCVGRGSATKLDKHRLFPFRQRHIYLDWLSGSQSSAEARRWFWSEVVQRPWSDLVPPVPKYSAAQNLRGGQTGTWAQRGGRVGCRLCRLWEGMDNLLHRMVSGYGRRKILAEVGIAGDGVAEHV